MESRIFEILKLGGSSFYLKCVKFCLDFQHAIKNCDKKTFFFLDNCIWIGCARLSLEWWEYLSLTVIVFKNSPNITDLTKREILQLNSSQNDETKK